MKLIMVEKWIPTHQKFDIIGNLEGELTFFNYDGRSWMEIEKNLKREIDDAIIVTADSRFMRYVNSHSFFQLEDTFIYRNGSMKNIKETTKRILRDGHNMMKLYDTGEFDGFSS